MCSNRKPPHVGQVLYSLNVGNAARRAEQVLTPVKVVKVGRKYFSTAGPTGRTYLGKDFYLSDWTQKSEYCADQRLYESEQEWLDEKEAEDARKYIRSELDWTAKKLPLGVLRQMRDIMAKHKEQQDEAK